MKNKILLGLLSILIGIQFIRPAKNESGIDTNHISKKYPVSEQLAVVFEAACNDCHSNKTKYPWYYNIQPIGFWLNNHVTDGKRHLNFSEFISRPIAYQNHKLEEIIEEVKEKEMPLPSYTYLGLHPDANLTDGQRQLIMDWAKAQMDTLKATYPPDSLVLRRRQGPPPGQ